MWYSGPAVEDDEGTAGWGEAAEDAVKCFAGVGRE